VKGEGKEMCGKEDLKILDEFMGRKVVLMSLTNEDLGRRE
jgi:hypothetical protein